MAQASIGLSEVLGRLNQEIEGIENRSMEGLMEAGNKILGISSKMVPVATGNLKGSGYARKAQGGGMAVEIGYSANYAVYVHEDLEKMHTNGTAKFLEKALRNNEGSIVEIVRQQAEVE